MHRRHFIGSLGGAALGVMPRRSSAADPAPLPNPQGSGIEHIVVVMMENRSFDHLLGWLPGADGKQAGLTYADKDGNPHSTYPLAPDYTGCGHNDPEHNYDDDRVAYNGGAMDGFFLPGGNDLFSIGHHTEAQLPFLAAVTRRYTVFHRPFWARDSPPL